VRCPYCKVDNDKVIDSRSSAEGSVIRRRRVCLACERRYTTYERIEERPLRVVKKDGTRVPFDRSKILRGLHKACEKRSITADQLERIVVDVEARILETYDREVQSNAVGELIMERLKHLDQVAYIRFASVYREFKDATDFVAEVTPMLEKGRRP
jgi:transcriptional repressor NrdR